MKNTENANNLGKQSLATIDEKSENAAVLKKIAFDSIVIVIPIVIGLFTGGFFLYQHLVTQAMGQ